MSARVTFAIPIAPRQRWLDVALQSIEYQRYDDWTVAAVLDGPCEQNFATLEASPIFDRIRVVVMPGGSGIARCLNVALESGGSEYVARLDADDLARPDRLALQVELLDSDPRIGVAGTWAQTIDEDGVPIGVLRPPTEPHTLRRRMLWRNSLIHPSVLMRRAVAVGVGGYQPACQRTEDYELWLRILVSHEVANVGEYATLRRVHGAMHSRGRSDIGDEWIMQARIDVAGNSAVGRLRARLAHEAWMWNMRRRHGA